MNINATLFGQFLFVLAIVLAFVGYYLGKRKTTTPKLVAVIVFFSALIQPLGLILIIVLALKKDLPKGQVEHA